MVFTEATEFVRAAELVADVHNKFVLAARHSPPSALLRISDINRATTRMLCIPYREDEPVLLAKTVQRS